MPALLPTTFTGTITWLGRVPHRDKQAPEGVAEDELALRFDGLGGSAHAGLTRPSCSRVLAQHPRGTEIRNTRQLSLVAAEDLDAIAAECGLESLDPVHLGASIVIAGISDFTHIPPSSRLQAENGATIIVDMENRPCHLPAKAIEAVAPGHGKAFKAAATDRRGVVGSVEREGLLRVGDTLTLHIPDQAPWAHIDEARKAG